MSSASPCIAVVDDEGSVRTMLGRVLRLGGYDVASFGSGEAFIASLAEQVPACAIVDVHMPGLSGFDVQSRMREMGIGVPVIFITASDERSLDGIVQQAHGVALLRKPFSSDELLAAICTALQTEPGHMP